MTRRAWLVSLALIVPSAARAHSFEDPIFVPDPGATAGDNFGLIAITAGNDFLVSAPVIGLPIDANGNPAARNNPGVVYLIDRQRGSVVRAFDEPSFNGMGPLPTDSFGFGLATDGVRVAVGAPAANGGVGVVFVFDLASGKLLNSITEPGGGCPGDNFGGISLAIGGDTLIASAYGWSAPEAGCTSSEFFEGRAWAISLRTGEATMTYASPEATSGQLFGWGFLPTCDDLLITASQFPLGPSFPGGPGVAYLMNAMTGRLDTTIPDPDGVVGDGFGDAPPVPVWGGFAIPAQSALVTNSAGAQVQAGAVHVFDEGGRHLLTIRDPLASAGDYFGDSLGYAVSGFLVAAPGGGPPSGYPQNTPPGHAYVYSSRGHLMHTFEAPKPQPNDGFGTAVAQIGGDVAATSTLTNDGQGGLWIFHQHDVCDDEECF